MFALQVHQSVDVARGLELLDAILLELVLGILIERIADNMRVANAKRASQTSVLDLLS